MFDILDEVELYSIYVLFLGTDKLVTQLENIVATDGLSKWDDLDGYFYGD